MNEIIFVIEDASEGGFTARALGHAIFTQGEDWDDIQKNAREAVLCHFEDDEAPKVIRLHYVRQEIIAV